MIISARFQVDGNSLKNESYKGRQKKPVLITISHDKYLKRTKILLNARRDSFTPGFVAISRKYLDRERWQGRCLLAAPGKTSSCVRNSNAPENE